MTTGPVPHLSDATVAGLLDLGSVTELLASAFAEWGRHEAATTQRVRAATKQPAAMASAMAAAVPSLGVTGGKVYATVDGVFTFVVVLFDLDGRWLCTLDGDALTRFRTPAGSALAIRHLAAPDPTVAALVGCGRQGWYHLEMLAAELPHLAEVRLCDTVPSAAEAMAARAVEAGIPAVVAATPTAAVDGADVVVTVTKATQPLFPADQISDRTLICAVGATKYDRVEIGADVVARCAAVVCDDVTGSRVECGDLIAAAAAGAFDWGRAVELHDLCAGTVGVPRAGAAPVLFETQGVALQDVATAGLAWRRFTTAPKGDQ